LLVCRREYETEETGDRSNEIGQKRLKRPDVGANKKRRGCARQGWGRLVRRTTHKRPAPTQKAKKAGKSNLCGEGSTGEIVQGDIS